MQKKLALLLTVILFFCGKGPVAEAANSPDPTQKGSIEITMQSDGTAVPGGSLTLYQVGKLTEENGVYSYEFLDSLQTTGLDLNDLQSPKLAEALAQKVTSTQGNKKEIDEAGKIAFTDLELGIYLLIQEEAAKGYSKLGPFLVTVPEVVNGEYIYQVQAGPKIALEPDVTPTPAPTDPPSATPTPQPEGTPTPSESSPTPPESTPTPPESTPTPSESNPTPPENNPTPSDNSAVEKPQGSSAEVLPPPKLPQTGQLNWPIPVMAVSGLWIFAMGWMLRYGQKRDRVKK